MSDEKRLKTIQAGTTDMKILLSCLIQGTLRRIDGSFNYGGKYYKFETKKFKYSAYTINSPGGVTYRIDIREVPE